MVGESQKLSLAKSRLGVNIKHLIVFKRVSNELYEISPKKLEEKFGWKNQYNKRISVSLGLCSGSDMQNVQNFRFHDLDIMKTMEKCIHGKSNWPCKRKCVPIVVAYTQIDFESYIVPCDRALAHPALPLQMPILGPLLHYGNATYSIIAMQLRSTGYSCFS